MRNYRNNSLEENNSRDVIEKKITTISEYLEVVGWIYDSILRVENRGMIWYRGQPREEYELIPSIARPPLNPKLEIIYLSKFKSLSVPYAKSLITCSLPGNTTSYWNWLFLMQHYGIPTRLLDWSRDALTALYFAVYSRNPSDEGHDAVVWLLNPVKLNEEFSFYNWVKPGYIPNVEEEPVNLYFGPDAKLLESRRSAAVIGALNNSRIIAQKGVFTVSPHMEKIIPLDKHEMASKYLYKIIISKENIPLMRKRLELYGLNSLTLFPEMSKVRNEVKRQVEKEGALSEYFN